MEDEFRNNGLMVNIKKSKVCNLNGNTKPLAYVCLGIIGDMEQGNASLECNGSYIGMHVLCKLARPVQVDVLVFFKNLVCPL